MENNRFLKAGILLLAALFCGNTASAQWQAASGNVSLKTATDKVGIGTAAPKAKLHIAGHTYADGEIVVRKLLYVGDDAAINNGTPTIRFGANGSGTNEGIGSNRDNTKPNFKGLDFYTGVANNRSMSITNTGNVGIGTTSPKERLHIAGHIYADGDIVVRKVLYVGDDAAINNGTSSLRFGSNGSGTGEGIGSNRDNTKTNFKGLDFYTGNEARLNLLQNGKLLVKKQLVAGAEGLNNGTKIDLAFGGDGSGEGIGSKRTATGNQWGLDFFTASTNRMTITKDGNVGIGTISPGQKLSVNGGLRVENKVSVGGADVVEVDAPGIVGGRMKIGTDGKVGIGISDPAKMPGAYKLYVADGIMTERLKVALKNSANWADYVFSDGYRLLPLAEVESFLKKERHLPNVPSAAEVAENGIDVAAMDAKLLEKIEELTLYVIGIQKENEALRARVGSLEKVAK